MTRTTVLAGMATLVAGMSVGALLAQQAPQGPQPFFVGNRLGLPVNRGRPQVEPADRRACRRDSGGPVPLVQ